MPSARNDGEKIFYNVFGNGEPLVLIMGLGLPHNEWCFQIEYFSKHYKVIAIDNRGVGKSSKSGNFSIQQFAYDVNAVLEEEGINHCIFLAVSMGTLIAQAFYHLFPAKVKALILASTGFGPGAPSYVYPSAQVYEALSHSPSDPNKDNASRRLKIAYHPDYLLKPGCSIKDILIKRKSYNLCAEGYFAQTDAIRSYNEVKKIDQIKAPTLIIHALEDQLSPVKAAYFMRERIEHSVLITIPECGHMFFVEKHNKFNAAVNSFIEHVDSNDNLSSLDEYIESSGIEHNSSETARQVAFMRAFAYAGNDFNVKSNDHLAEKMLHGNQQQHLRGEATRKMIESNYFAPGSYGYLFARTAYVDQLFIRALKTKIDQILILGAGFDTRAYRFDDLNAETIIFEVDVVTTQTDKIKTLEKSQIRTPENLKFVPVNFKKDSLQDQLIKYGFVVGLKTLVIWEGVTMYLDQVSFDKTIFDLKEICGTQSELYFDYFYKDMIDGNDSYYGAAKSRAAVNNVNEKYTFGFSINDFYPRIKSYGLCIIEHLNPHEIEKRFLAGARQKEHARSYGFSCFAHLQI